MRRPVASRLKGELATEGMARLPGVLVGQPFQALLLMEGANDIADRDTVTMNLALTAMRSMVQTAKGRGLRVFLATLPPQEPGSRNFGGYLLPQYNDRIRAMAASENVALVDVFQAFGGTAGLIDVDGLHPTAAGYQRIAETFFASIRQALELAPAPSSLTSMTRTR